jgi:hypothetical protein
LLIKIVLTGEEITEPPILSTRRMKFTSFLALFDLLRDNTYEQNGSDIAIEELWIVLQKNLPKSC